MIIPTPAVSPPLIAAPDDELNVEAVINELLPTIFLSASPYKTESMDQLIELFTIYWKNEEISASTLVFYVDRAVQLMTSNMRKAASVSDQIQVATAVSKLTEKLTEPYYQELLSQAPARIIRRLAVKRRSLFLVHQQMNNPSEKELNDLVNKICHDIDSITNKCFKCVLF